MADLLVSTFQRGGSSLVMQMLDAAGFPVHGEYPAYEPDTVSIGKRNRDASHLSYIDGAVKLLEPSEWTRPDWPLAARAIWLDRDPYQRARSADKLMSRVYGERPLTRAQRQGLAASYRRERLPAMRALSQFLEPKWPILTVSFDNLVTRPQQEAERIGEFLNMDTAQIAAMAAEVRPRDPKSYPGLLEAQLIAERATLNDNEARP